MRRTKGRRPFFYEMLREEGFVPDEEWSNASDDTRHACERLARMIREYEPGDEYSALDFEDEGGDE